MNGANPNQTFRMNTTSAVCPIGEATGKKNIAEPNIPVLSCEGACIRGEIARLAANIVSKDESYGRGCHGRIIETMIDADKLVQFDALSHYNQYTDIFDYEDVPEKERKEVAQSVADWVIDSLEKVPAEGLDALVQTEGRCGTCCG